MARELGRSRVRQFESLEPRWALNAADYAGGFSVSTSASGQQVAVQGDLGILVLRDGKVSRNAFDDQLDTTFGDRGFVDLKGTFQHGGELASDSSDRILVGAQYPDRAREAVLLRFLADGTPDTTFGNQGRVVFARPGVWEHIEALAPLLSGGVLVGLHGVGDHGSVDAVVRLDASGQLDPTFGLDGWFLAQPGQLLTPAVSVSDVVYLGVENGAATQIAVQRLTVAGEIDHSYGNNGTVSIPFEGVWPVLGDLDVDSQGRALAQIVDKLHQVKVVRIDQQGVIDSGFGNQGIATFDLPNTDYAVPGGIEVQPNGRVLVGCYTATPTQTLPIPQLIYRSYLWRLTSEGDIDLTFGKADVYNFEYGPAWSAMTTLVELALRDNGEIVASLVTPSQSSSVNGGGVARLVGDPIARPPRDIRLLVNVVPEDAPLGYVVGALTATNDGSTASGLMMFVDRTDLSVRVVNLTDKTQDFSSYRLGSASGQLSRTGWRSIADWVAEGPEAKASAEQILGVGHTGWKEVRAGSTILWEGVDVWTGLEPGEEIELGKPLRSFPSDINFAVIDYYGTTYGEVMWEPAPLNFELLDSANGLFRLDGNRLVIADPSMLDYESIQQYTIQVRATNEGGSFTQNLVVEVGNVNEAPTIDTPAVWLTQPNAWLAMVGIVLDDPDLQGDDLNTRTSRLHLRAENGIVQLGSVARLAITAGENSTALLEAEGTLPALNAALATLSFRASANFSGMALVNIRLDDRGSMGSGPARATDAALRITINSAPAATADEFNVAFGGALSGAAVLGNDADSDGDRLTALLVESPRHGTLQFAADGSFSYVPNPDFFGRDSFRYRAVDGFFESAETEVLLDVGAGDADLDGDVDLTDLGILKANFGVGTTRAQGDFNGDGRIDLDDFGLLKAAFSSAVEENARSRNREPVSLGRR